MKKLIMAIILVMMTIGPANAREEIYYWCAPEDGTPVVYYNVQIEIDGAGWIDIGTSYVEESIDDGFYALTIPIGVHQLRVQGVDANGNVGEWSIASDVYEYGGEPGIACKPRLFR